MPDEIENEIPRILPPSDDGVFKTLLTHADAEPVRCDLISSFVELPVTSAAVRNSELPISGKDEKQERFDVSCAIDGNDQIEVEMQAKAMLGDALGSGHKNLKNRTVYNLCDLHSSQPGAGIEYGRLVRSFQITFCDFAVFRDGGLVHRFSMRDKDGAELVDSINILFVELTSLGGALRKTAGEMSGAEKWAVFLKYSGNPKYGELLKEIVDSKEEIRMANAILDNISTNEDERAKFRARRKFQMDMAHDRAYLLRIGEENLLKGRLEGKLEGKLETARNLIRRGRPIDEIIEDTGLARAEIEGLRKDI